MRAVWYDRQGPADEVLVCGELADAGPRRPGELRVRLEASGVNPPTPIAAAGRCRRNIPASSRTATAPAWWTASAPACPDTWIGKRVWLYNGQRNGRWMGTAAEYITLSADLVTALPDHVSFAEGATLGIPAMTAHRCVFVAGPVQGRFVLVTGGAGAVGHYAVQLAAWAGATVIATVSSEEKAERARAGRRGPWPSTTARGRRRAHLDIAGAASTTWWTWISAVTWR